MSGNLARVAADHPIEDAGGRVEHADVPAPDNVRPAHDGKTLGLERAVHEAHAREDAQDEAHRRCTCRQAAVPPSAYHSAGIVSGTYAGSMGHST